MKLLSGAWVSWVAVCASPYVLVCVGQSHIKGMENILLTLVESGSGPLWGKLGTASCKEVFKAMALLFSLL